MNPKPSSANAAVAITRRRFDWLERSLVGKPDAAATSGSRAEPGPTGTRSGVCGGRAAVGSAGTRAQGSVDRGEAPARRPCDQAADGTTDQRANHGSSRELAEGRIRRADARK